MKQDLKTLTSSPKHSESKRIDASGRASRFCHRQPVVAAALVLLGAGGGLNVALLAFSAAVGMLNS